jgi:hypothetical protein
MTAKHVWCPDYSLPVMSSSVVQPFLSWVFKRARTDINQKHNYYWKYWVPHQFHKHFPISISSQG